MKKVEVKDNATQLIEDYYKLQTLLFHGDEKKKKKSILKDEKFEKRIREFVKDVPEGSTLEMKIGVQCYYGDYESKKGIKRYEKSFNGIKQLIDEKMDLPDDIVFVRVIGKPVICHEDGKRQKCDRLENPAFENRVWILDGEGKELEDRIRDLQTLTKSSKSPIYKLYYESDNVFGFKDFKSFCTLFNVIEASQLTSV